MTRTKRRRMKQVDRVRWALLSAADRDRLIAIGLCTNHSKPTILRILRRRYNGSVDAYAKAVLKPMVGTTLLPIATRLRKDGVDTW